MSPVAKAAHDDVGFYEDAESHQLLAFAQAFRGLHANLSEPHWTPKGFETDAAGWEVISDALETMSRFCHFRHSAAEFRLAGDVDAALSREASAERLYARLPEGWRW